MDVVHTEGIERLDRVLGSWSARISLSGFYKNVQCFRIIDGTDEVHMRSVAKHAFDGRANPKEVKYVAQFHADTELTNDGTMNELEQFKLDDEVVLVSQSSIGKASRRMPTQGRRSYPQISTLTASVLSSIASEFPGVAAYVASKGSIAHKQAATDLGQFILY